MAGRPKPAPIPTPRGFRLHFCYKGRQYKKGLIKNQHRANILQARVNSLLIDVKNGDKTPPKDKQINEFIFDTVLEKEEVENKQRSGDITCLSGLMEEYLKKAHLRVRPRVPGKPKKSI